MVGVRPCAVEDGVLSPGRHGDELQLPYRHAYLVAAQVATTG
ncbi:hypothetical protein [Streptomyces sp. NBC_01602]|nr:hypothetical protein OG955_00805 [Streptomyces sp. NBC_01602]